MRLIPRCVAKVSIQRLLSIRSLLVCVSGTVCICLGPGLLVAQRVTNTPIPPAPATPTESRIAVAPGLKSRSAALQDPQFAIKAMGLSAAQEQGLVQVRARYVIAIKGYVARLNVLEQDVAHGSASKETLGATEDTLRAILTAEHAAADSLLTPAQKQRYLNAIRQVHTAGVINPGAVNQPAARPAARTATASSTRKAPASPSLVPIP